MCVRFKVEYWS